MTDLKHYSSLVSWKHLVRSTSWKLIFRNLEAGAPVEKLEDKHLACYRQARSLPHPDKLEAYLPGSLISNVINLTPFWAGSS